MQSKQLGRIAIFSVIFLVSCGNHSTTTQPLKPTATHVIVGTATGRADSVIDLQGPAPAGNSILRASATATDPNLQEILYLQQDSADGLLWATGFASSSLVNFTLPLGNVAVASSVVSDSTTDGAYGLALNQSRIYWGGFAGGTAYGGPLTSSAANLNPDFSNVGFGGNTVEGFALSPGTPDYVFVAARPGGNVPASSIFIYADAPASNPGPLAMFTLPNEPIAVAFDGAGNLWVSEFLHRGVGEIAEFGAADLANLIASACAKTCTAPAPVLTITGIDVPPQIAFDSAGFLYFTQFYTNKILVFTPPSAGTPALYATVAGPFTFPAGLAVY